MSNRMDEEMLRKDLVLYGKLLQRRLGPIAGQVEVTADCSQKCIFCHSRADAKKFGYRQLSLAQGWHLIRVLSESPVFENLTLTGGDPQCWPELDGFLRYYIEKKCSFQLQINTALALPFEQSLWTKTFSSVRVSIDALTLAGYKKTRGVELDPLQIIERMRELGVERCSVIFTASLLNIAELIPLARFLRDNCQVRKLMVLPAIGVEHSEEFWRLWEFSRRELADRRNFVAGFTSMSESSSILKRDFDPTVRCWAGVCGFHIKPNGDVYPCCLVGGEAASTDVRFRTTNISEDFLATCQDWMLGYFYADPKLPCRRICQFKQYQLNLAAEFACRTILRMP